MTKDLKKKLTDSILLSVDKEIDRLENLKKEKKKLLGKALITVIFCKILAKTDYGFIFKEHRKFLNLIFSRYHVTDEVLSSIDIKKAKLEDVEKLVSEYEIEKEFLQELYDLAAFSISQIGGETSSAERQIRNQFILVFDLSPDSFEGEEKRTLADFFEDLEIGYNEELEIASEELIGDVEAGYYDNYTEKYDKDYSAKEENEDMDEGEYERRG